MSQEVQEAGADEAAYRGTYSSHAPPAHLTGSEVHLMTVNGGRCLRGSGYWSQTISEVTVYLLLTSLAPTLASPAADTASKISSRIQIIFNKMEIHIKIDGILTHSLQLEYAINCSECTWTVDQRAAEIAHPSFVVLHLSKVPSLEWFPGCEWWDRVLLGEDPIDTACCSVGTDTASLPEQAKQRAEQQHIRFTASTPLQQSQELDSLATAKKVRCSPLPLTPQAALIVLSGVH